jgi:hypothetical protein
MFNSEIQLATILIQLSVVEVWLTNSTQLASFYESRTIWETEGTMWTAIAEFPFPQI